MDLSLPPQLADFVRDQVRSGRYVDEQEVVRDALRQMRSLVKAADDPTVARLVRDAVGIASQAQRDITSLLQVADAESSVFGEVLGHCGAVANVAVGVARRVPGAREIDRLVRGPLEGMTAAAEYGELQARAMRANLEATAKALGALTAVLERVGTATRTVGGVVRTD